MSSKNSQRDKGKIFFLCRSLELGGSERQLVTLAKALYTNGFDTHVVVFYPGGALEDELKNTGIVVHSLDKRRRKDNVTVLVRTIHLLRRERPFILHSYLADANTLAVLIKPFLPRTRILWGVRASNVHWDQYHWLSKLLFRISCRLARFADMIIVNSHAGRDFHVQHGYPVERMRVVPNGIDTDTLRPSPGDGERKRVEWGVGAHEILIGMVGRLDPMKDHPTFLRAASLLSERNDHVRFVCVGDGDPDYKARMYDLAQTLHLHDRLIWAGLQHDMQAVYNAFDISVLSSCGEGFPNVVGEAMSCGKVCVVTDVGDAARIVGDTGRVVPPGDPQRLSDAINEVIAMSKGERMDSEHRARYRIVEHFGVNALLERTLDAVGSLAGW